MNRTSPIYTEKNNCQDCYKCLRQCPVKAIKIVDASASVIPEDCIYCGHCVQVCPVGAKKVRQDLPGLIAAMGKNKQVIACLAPSYVSDFHGTSPAILVNALKRMGFNGVSETALGAELVSDEAAKWLSEQQNGICISSCCTAVVQLINRHYPHLSSHVIPLLSPMQSHAKLLKAHYGDDTVLAFFGPCIAKKHEVDEQAGLADYVLTFDDLRTWLDTDLPGWANMDDLSGNAFIPHQAGKGGFFPVDGGMIANLKENATLTDTSYMSFSGVKNIREVLDDIPNWQTQEKVFLELMLCEGGCIKGPCSSDNTSVAVKRQRTIFTVKKQPVSPHHLLPAVDIHYSYPIRVAPEPANLFSETDITNALRASGKFSKADELNCGGCGYDSCRDFAMAMLMEKAERIMCVSYTRKVAQDKASVLLKKMPYGVVVVDDQLRIIDANERFASLMGGEIDKHYLSLGSINGASITGMMPFHKLFSSVLHTGEEMIEHRLRVNGLFLQVSIVTIQPHKIVCGIIRNMQDPDVRKDLVLNSVKQVIRQQMDVVQKIAYLLGENASYTESTLNVVVESVDRDSDYHNSISANDGKE